MYAPDHFALPTGPETLALMRSAPLAILILVIHGRPEATPVPMIVDDYPDAALSLRFHLAKANPLCEAISDGMEALVHFSGPEHYVSPDWYETEGLPPTWNYLAVQARGTIERLDDTQLRSLLEDLSAEHEKSLPKPPWTMEKMSESATLKMSRAISGFRLRTSHVEGKAKLSQNRSARDRAGVVGELDALDRPAAAAVARRMRDCERSS